MGLLDVTSHPAHCDPSRPGGLDDGVEFFHLRLDVVRRTLPGSRLLTAFEPDFNIASLTSGMASAFTMPACNLSMIGFGVPAGASRPLQPTTTTLG